MDLVRLYNVDISLIIIYHIFLEQYVFSFIIQMLTCFCFFTKKKLYCFISGESSHSEPGRDMRAVENAGPRSKTLQNHF